jgi:hypothetical protein
VAELLFYIKCTSKNGGIAELAKPSIVHPGDPGSNLSLDRKYFLSLFVLHLNSNL